MQAAHESYADNPSSSISHKGKNKQNEDMKGAQFIVQSNLKIMARSIAALSKISEDVHIEVSENGLFFKVFHRCKYCVFRFAPDFFNSCDLTMINKRAANICRLSMKSALRIFKGVTFGEKGFVGCEFRIDPRAEKMVVNMQMNYDINRMIHVKLREMSTSLQKVVYDRTLYRNKTVVFASTLIPIMAQMKADIEVTLKVDKNGLTIRNFHSSEGTTIFNASEMKSTRRVKTETTIQLDKLTRHEVPLPVEFSFSLKDFLAIATFADQLGSEVCMYYDLPPRPMILSIEAHANFDIELAMATLGKDDEVDLDGGILEEVVVLENTTKSSKTSQESRRKNSTATEEVVDITSSSSRSKRGPIQTQDVPAPSSRRSSRSSTNNQVPPVTASLTAVAEQSWRDNEVEMVDQPAHDRVPEPENRTMNHVNHKPRDPMQELTFEVIQGVSFCAADMNADSMVRVHEGPEEIVEGTLPEDEERECGMGEDQEKLFRVPEAKKKKIIPARNKRTRRIMMGMTATKQMRMSQQDLGAPLVTFMDTQQ